MTAKRLLIPATLAADAILFFARPLFSNQYSFPWDFRLVQVPLITFLADQLKKNDLPLWDPYTYCGNPIYANIQACFFHPLVFLAALLSSFAGEGSLARLLEWMVVLQVIVAGVFTYRLARHLNCTQAGACVAAVICQTGPYFASRTEHIGAMMAAAWMPAGWYAVIRMREKSDPRLFALLAAALGMSVLGGSPAATTAVFGSALALAVILFAARLGSLWNIARTAGGCALGIGVAAIAFIPSAELTANSVAKYRLDWLGTGGGLKWPALLSLVAPNFSHPGDPTFLYLFCSITGLLFALLAILLRWDRWVAVFALLGLAGSLFMMGDSTPLWRALWPLVPDAIRIGVHPEFTYCVFGECIALLAGIGISRLVSWHSAQWALAAVVALELYFVGANRPMNCASVRLEPGLTDRALDGSADLLQRVRMYSALDFPPARVDQTAGVSIAWSEAAPLTRVPTGSGASPLALERIIQIRLGLHSGGRAGWNYPVENFNSPMLDLMGERYLLASEAAAAKLALNPRFLNVAALPGAVLFENRTVLPRAFVVPSAKPAIHTSARFTEYSANHLAVTASSDAPALLVLSEAWYPGWEAHLDGKPVTIQITDTAFRGVRLPAGTHQVIMDFRPRILVYSALISILCVAGLVATIFYTSLRRDV